MLKIRFQGTIKDIKWFRKMLEQYQNIHVLQISEPYSNKGTNRYFRMYAEVEEVLR